MNGYSAQNNNAQTQIDFRTLPANVPSLCIPRVFNNIGENRIRKVINELKMGDIERIDIVNKSTEKGEKFNRVFIHFKKWFNEGNAAVARERLINGKDIKIVYDDPWFWKVTAYVQPKPRSQYEPKKPSFRFDDSNKNEFATKQSSTESYKSKYQPHNHQAQNSYKKPMKMNREQQVQLHETKIDRVFEPRSPSTSPPPLQVKNEPEIYSEAPILNYGKISLPKRRIRTNLVPAVNIKPKLKLQIINPNELEYAEDEEDEDEEYEERAL